MTRAIAVSVLLVFPPLFAFGQIRQRNVDVAHQGERIYAVVPVVGAGTARDPKRPLLAPGHGENAANRTAVTGYRVWMSDDGKTALVELKAQDARAFAPFLQANRPDVKTFERGKSQLADVVREFQKVKPSFSVEQLAGGLR